VNFIDPSGLAPNYLCKEYGMCWSGGTGADRNWGSVSAGFWGSGYLGGNGWGSDPNPGLRGIAEAEDYLDWFMREEMIGPRGGKIDYSLSDFFGFSGVRAGGRFINAPSTREQRCAEAIAQARRIHGRISKTMADGLLSPNGIDAGHLQKIDELQKGLDDALRKIDINCNNKEKEQISNREQMEKALKARPPLGEKVPLQKMKLTAAAAVIISVAVPVISFLRYVLQ